MRISHSRDRRGVKHVEGSADLLQEVLEYELACAERYRRFVSLVMVKEGDSTTQLEQILADKVRDSDLLAEKNSNFLILMSETDRKGAQSAISRFVDRDGEVHDFRFALVTYPNDSGSAETLIQAAERRLMMAVDEGPGAIVSGD